MMMDGNQMKICAQVKIAAKHDQETRNPHNQKELKRRRQYASVSLLFINHYGISNKILNVNT